MEWFDYSIIRYMPNLKRGEVVNIGLAVKSLNGIEIMLLENPSKIRMLDGTSDETSLQCLNENITEILETYELKQCVDFVNKMQKGIYLSEVSSFRLGHFDSYRKKVDHLYSQLVKPYSLTKPKARKSQCRLMSDIRKNLNKHSLISNNRDDLYNHKIIPSYVLNEKSGLTADFMLKNGVYHMSSVVDFNVNDTTQKFKETGLKALSFLEGEKRVSNDIKKYFVYSVDFDKEKEISGHLGLVEDNCDDMFNMKSQEESMRYYELMLELTKVDSLNLNHP